MSRRNPTVHIRLGVMALLLPSIFGAYLYGRQVGERDLSIIMDMPSGGMYLAHHFDTVFWKLDAGNFVRWQRIPNPYQAHLVQLFGAPPPATTATTSTTLPEKEKKP